MASVVFCYPSSWEVIAKTENRSVKGVKGGEGATLVVRTIPSHKLGVVCCLTVRQNTSSLKFKTANSIFLKKNISKSALHVSLYNITQATSKRGYYFAITEYKTVKSGSSVNVSLRAKCWRWDISNLSAKLFPKPHILKSCIPHSPCPVHISWM